MWRVNPARHITLLRPLPLNNSRTFHASNTLTPKMPFDYSRDYRELNLREHPELYAVGKGEQGVLMVQPYKSEILPHWRFKNPEIARESSQKIYDMFLEYKKNDDFVGMDMARKFLMMGWTRARRYANHKSGQKYEKRTKKELEEYHAMTAEEKVDTNSERQGKRTKLENEEDLVKAEAAAIFRVLYLKAYEDPEYRQKMVEFKDKYEGSTKKVSAKKKVSVKGEKPSVKEEKRGIKREPQDDQPTLEQVIKKAK
ncbi:hypothetical protein PROFUN_01342 [Planoprotostelium fungivorum]|uniref:DUF4385 domain containing protein n=1 Tax=Planoprotostelium fungivorum TaxID=1890364 RepID=A0A2P6NZX7_9EUKA|nr:hypothetical protein PROFUN_01342 [Planoprotostelium fungivorum]